MALKTTMPLTDFATFLGLTTTEMRGVREIEVFVDKVTKVPVSMRVTLYTQQSADGSQREKTVQRMITLT